MKAAMPIILAQILWGVSVPMQTAILGHLSDDAIAANSCGNNLLSIFESDCHCNDIGIGGYDGEMASEEAI